MLVTGHTGFKGSWLCRWLERLGAEVGGYALPAEGTPNHSDLLGFAFRQWAADIRDERALNEAWSGFRPEIVFHLAAQSLVRRSYRAPVETIETNVLGTARVLEACRRSDTVRAVVIVTSDKCYRNREWPWAYRENDELGGHDPYSASKACAELVASSYRDAFARENGMLVATARAGNVIGGGDWAEDRLVPDLMRGAASGKIMTARNPHATRPWQHVLDPLAGYLILGAGLLDGRAEHAAAWNFGPDRDANVSVGDVLARMASQYPGARYDIPELPAQPHEAGLLMVDSTRARTLLGWRPRYALDRAIEATATWYRTFYETGHVLTDEQIAHYQAAMEAGEDA